MVNKREMNLLEKVFAKEITGGLFQTSGKLAKKLEDEGYLVFVEKRVQCQLGMITVKGYRLTILGNATYCLSCADIEETP